MRSIRPFLVLAAFVAAFAVLIVASQPRPRASSPKPVAPQLRSGLSVTSDLAVGEPIVYRNLAIFPVSTKSPRLDDRFITLDEGLKAGTVEVFEKGAVATADEANLPTPPASDDPFGDVADDPFGGAARNEVNELMIVNRSEKPLYLMPGEIIVGGSQDRTIGEELIIAADGKPVSISVYCVERGRWGSRDEGHYAQLLASPSADGETVALAVYPSADLSLIVSQTTEAANSGKFIGSVGSLNKQARLAVQKGDGQQRVWEEVAAENAKASVQPLSETFSANYAGTDAAERLAPYMESLREPVANVQNVVGVIVAVNGKVESLDVFQSTPLFQKLWPKLLKSHALDAANAAENQEAGKVATRDDARAFLGEVGRAKAEAVDPGGELALRRGESDGVLVFSAHERRDEDISAPADGGIGGMGFGGAIHASGYSK